MARPVCIPKISAPRHSGRVLGAKGTAHMPPIHFLVFMLVSLVLFAAILAWSLRNRSARPGAGSVIWVAMVVVVAGMVFARFGARAGLPWPVYYGVPALTTLLLPPIVFRMARAEVLRYELLAFASSPLIHASFSFLLGWHEYMPFWHIPSMAQAFGP